MQQLAEMEISFINSSKTYQSSNVTWSSDKSVLKQRAKSVEDTEQHRENINILIEDDE